MDTNDKIQIFEAKRIRTAWDEEAEEWYFSVVDVVAVLTDSTNPTDYLKKMRKRDEQLAAYLGTNCPQVAMRTTTGKLRKTLAANTEQLLRIIQSIPSPRGFLPNTATSARAATIAWKKKTPRPLPCSATLA